MLVDRVVVVDELVVVEEVLVELDVDRVVVVELEVVVDEVDVVVAGGAENTHPLLPDTFVLLAPAYHVLACKALLSWMLM